MRLSDDKITHITNIVFRSLVEKGLIRLKAEDTLVRKEIKRSIIEELRIGDEIDEIVRKKLKSASGRLIEGSPEWEIQYRKLFKEEEIKRGRIPE